MEATLIPKAERQDLKLLEMAKGVTECVCVDLVKKATTQQNKFLQEFRDLLLESSVLRPQK
jgi:hypothetical protein